MFSLLSGEGYIRIEPCISERNLGEQAGHVDLLDWTILNTHIRAFFQRLLGKFSLIFNRMSSTYNIAPFQANCHRSGSRFVAANCTMYVGLEILLIKPPQQCNPLGIGYG
jgi:hypothetical protein